MSTVENLGNTKTIRIGEASDQEVDNYSKKLLLFTMARRSPSSGEKGATTRQAGMKSQAPINTQQ